MYEKLNIDESLYEEYLEYKKKYLSNYKNTDMRGLIDNYKSKLELLDLNYDIKFLIINHKIFIRYINFSKSGQNIYFEVPEFVFGFSLPDRYSAVKNTFSTFISFPEQSLTIKFTKPVVALETPAYDGDRIPEKTFAGMIFTSAEFSRLELKNFKAKFCKLDRLFYQSSIKEIIFDNDFDMCNNTDTSGMFETCTDLIKIDFGNNFDTSRIEKANRMFSQCWELEEIKTGKELDFSSLKEASGILNGASDYTANYISNRLVRSGIDHEVFK